MRLLQTSKGFGGQSKMVLISNHVLSLSEIKLGEDVVIRINIAWVRDIVELKGLLETTAHNIFIDYPESRTKPPVPSLNYSVVVETIQDYPNVKYLAVSNIESGTTAGLYRQSMCNGVSFVPKIETERGIQNLVKIIIGAEPEYIMLDTEDLFLDMKGDANKYNHLLGIMDRICKLHKVKILKLHGVVFYAE